MEKKDLLWQQAVMQPGRQLDALVAEKVMGFTERFERNSDGEPRTYLIGPKGEELDWYPGEPLGRWDLKFDAGIAPYSTDIAAAWAVVEKLRPRFDYSSVYFEQEREGDRWVCVLGTDTAQADTAPHAICLAALKAVGA